jgi:hypothetical protein
LSSVRKEIPSNGEEMMTLFLDHWEILNESFGVAKEILGLKDMLKNELMKDGTFYECYLDTYTKNMKNI